MGDTRHNAEDGMPALLCGGLLDRLPVGVYRTDKNGTILDCNTALALLLGYERKEQLLRLNASSFYLSKQERRKRLSLVTGEEPNCVEFKLKRRDRGIIWVRDYTYAALDERGGVLYYEGIIMDMTEQKAAAEALKQSESDYRNLFERAHDAILIITAEDEIILDANERACELYGFPREELIGRSLESLSKNVSLGKERIRRTIENAHFDNFETVHYNKNREEMILEVNAAVVSYQGRRAILSINRDITDRKKMEETIHRLAYYDSLSGLPNRKLFFDRLSQALARAERSLSPAAVLFLDLDGFKSINDNYGHVRGDEVIAEVGARLSAITRKGDTVARLGGDEFVVLVPDTGTEEGTARIASKILKEIGKPYRIHGMEEKLSVSIGISVYPRDGRTPEALLKKADIALYRVKTKGKNGFELYSPARKE